MKILMVTMSMNIGGAETHILELCRELISRGESVTLASFGGVYADEAVRFGVRHVTLPLNTKKPAAVMKAYRGLRKLILQERFDVVHAHARIPAFICGLLHDHLRLDGYKFRFVTTAHLDFSTNALWRRISRWGERVMVVSDDIADYMVTEYAYPRERIYKTINGIDTAKFSPSTDFDGIIEKHGLDSSRRRIVYMSRLDSDRADAAFVLIRIAPRIAELYPDCDIVIVGGGDRLDEAIALADETNRAIGRDIIKIAGAVSNTNEYCAAADVFIGVSRSALEAMSAARPVIIAGNQGSLGVFDESKIAHAVATNFCCRGYDCATEDSLFADLSRILDMTDGERAKMGEYNRAFIEKYYTTRRMADDYENMYEETLASPALYFGAPDVVISGYYGFGNLGDESLLDAISCSLADAYPGIKIAALTRNPRRDSKRTGLKCTSRFNMAAVFCRLSRAKLLISGGGSLLQDTTSKRSLRYYAGVMRMAKSAGASVFVYANGIGPIGHESNRKLTAKVVSRADAVSVRDADSVEELISLGVPREKIRLSADPAFTIKPVSAERREALISELGVDGGYFAVSVRPLTIRGGESVGGEAENGAVVKKIAEACREIAEKYGITPVLVPMQASADIGICDAIVRELAASGVRAVTYKPRVAAELMGVLAGARFAIAMRLHVVVFASSVGCPVIGVSYDPKVESMMRGLGQEYCAKLMRDAKEADLARDLIRYTDEVCERDGEIRTALSENAERMRKLAGADTREVGKYI